MVFMPGDLVRDSEGDTYKVVFVDEQHSTLDLETTEGTLKTVFGAPAHHFHLSPLDKRDKKSC